MPSIVVTADDTAAEIAAERENAVVLAKSLTIDNQGGITDRVITLQDVFTPSAYYGVATPGDEDIERFRALVAAGDIITWGEEDLKEVKCLGAMKVLSNVADEVGGVDDHCYVTVGYKHE
ncbi:unnamed protein product [marine sediment metagenome]|uniref:Uncharacterized protein n=1 Tax=marine sediment metagenome TaxID=412755 RepID=X1JVJ8_9ZZZZ